MKLPTRRIRYLLIAAFVLIILVVVFGVEYVNDLDPCPLCMLQRIALVGIGVVALLAAIHNARKWAHWVYFFFITFLTITGLATAARQLWLQSLPADLQPSTCGVDIYYLLQMLPFDKAMLQIFQGNSECTQVDWSFLGIGMAAWSLLCFMVIALLTALQYFRD